MKPKSCCEVCGYRLGLVSAWAYLEMGAYYRAHNLKPRWPRRRVARMRCPECGYRIILCQQVSRDVVEFA